MRNIREFIDSLEVSLMANLINVRKALLVIKNNYSILFDNIKKFISDFTFNKRFSSIYSSKTWTVIITTSFLILFNDLIIKVISKYIVNQVLSHIHKSILLDIVFIVLSSLFGYFLYYKARIKFKPSFIQYFFFGLILFQYIHFRVFEQIWLFENCRSILINKCCYTDIILLIILFPITKIICFHLVPINLNKSIDFFTEDIPITKKESDSLGRTDYATQIANAIRGQKFKKAFTIGILGPWGSGKTSFLNCVIEDLKDPNIVNIEFNPFYNYDEKSIINEFFYILSNSIKKYDANLSVKFEEYGKHLIHSINNKGLEIFQDTFYLINNEKPLTVKDQYDKINIALTRLDKKLVIVIDDIDRLNHLEILQILKLIRNTADFANTVYLIAFDKDYVTKALSNQNKFNNENFLQKFFQYEFILPRLTGENLRRKFFELISNNFDDNLTSDIRQAISPSGIITSTLFDIQMNTLRDVTRLANNFTMDYQKVKGEVDINDFINLEILKMKFTSAYLLLINNLYGYITRQSETIGIDNNDIYRLSKYNDNEYNSDNTNSEKNGKIKIFYELEKNKEEYSLRKTDIEDVQIILNTLFGKPLYGEELNHLSIKYPKNIDTYFNLRLLAGNISEVEFLKCFNSDIETFKEKINEWIKKGQESLVVERISKLKITDKKMLNQIIDGLFYIGTNTKSDYVQNLVIDQFGKTILFEQLIDAKIIKNQKEVGKYIFDNYLGKTDSWNNPFYSKFNFRLIKDIHPIDGGILGIKIEKWKENQSIYLKNYLSSLDKVDWNVYRLLNQNYDIGNITVNDLFKEFLIKKKSIKEFLSDIIDRDPFTGMYKISETVVKIFGNFNSFQEFFDNIEDNYIKEFREFYDLLKYFDFNRFINFEFKIIQLRDYGVKYHFQNRTEIFLDIKNDDLFSIIKSNKGTISNKFGSFLCEFPAIMVDKIIMISDFTQAKPKDVLTKCINELELYAKGKNLDKNIKIDLRKPYDGVLFEGEIPLIKLKSIQPRIQ